MKTPKFERVHTKNRLGALPQTPSRNRGPTSKGKGGEGKRGDGERRKGEDRGGEGRPRECALATDLGKHNHQQMNWLHSGRNCTRDKAAGYYRKFDSTSNRCCHVANEFTARCVCTLQGWRVRFTHAPAEISYDWARSVALLIQ